MIPTTAEGGEVKQSLLDELERLRAIVADRAHPSRDDERARAIGMLLFATDRRGERLLCEVADVPMGGHQGYPAWQRALRRAFERDAHGSYIIGIETKTGTVIVDAGAEPPTVTIPVTSDAMHSRARSRVGEIAEVISTKRGSLMVKRSARRKKRKK